jgi:hypothetical protein
MRSKLLIAATVASVLITLYLLHRLVHAGVLQVSRDSESPRTASAAAASAPDYARQPNAATASRSPEPAFRWSDVESDDIATYARNLRRAGFPEEAVRDALIPIVNQSYATMLAENARFAFPPRWAEAPKDVAERSAKAIDRARRAWEHTLETAFGMGQHEAQGYKPWHIGVRQEDLAQLEYSDRQRVEAMRKERTAQRGLLKARGLAGPELEAALRPLIEKQEAELATFLPEETVGKLATPASGPK